MTYGVGSNATTVTTMTGQAGMNRVLIARPQQAGQVLVNRNGMGPVLARAPQVIKLPVKLYIRSSLGDSKVVVQLCFKFSVCQF